MSGNKENAKLYKRHVNGLPGSMKVETFKQLQQRIPERIIEKAVHGMLPKGRLGRRIKLNLKVWSLSGLTQCSLHTIFLCIEGRQAGRDVSCRAAMISVKLMIAQCLFAASEFATGRCAILMSRSTSVARSLTLRDTYAGIQGHQPPT